MLALFFGVVTFFLYYWWKWAAKYRRLRSTTKLPPMYPGVLPILGHAHLLIGNTTRKYISIFNLRNDFLFFSLCLYLCK